MLTHKGTQTLETPRLILRRVAVWDAQAMFDNWASDPEVTKFLTWPPHGSVEITRAVIESWIGEYAKDDYYLWVIVLKEEGQPIGTISVVRLDEAAEKGEIGYCIGKKWWHRGITAEALQVVMDFLFDKVGMSRIEAMHDVNNPNSGAVMRKCGMKYEKTQRYTLSYKQGECDCACYGLSKWDRP